MPQAPLWRKQAGSPIVRIIRPAVPRAPPAIAWPAHADNMLQCGMDKRAFEQKPVPDLIRDGDRFARRRRVRTRMV